MLAECYEDKNPFLKDVLEDTNDPNVSNKYFMDCLRSIPNLDNIKLQIVARTYKSKLCYPLLTHLIQINLLNCNLLLISDLKTLSNASLAHLSDTISNSSTAKSVFDFFNS